MHVKVQADRITGPYRDLTRWQNSTLRYAPPESFPAFLEKDLGRAAIMRVWITLDEYWDYRTDRYDPDYEIGKARYPVSELHYPYDWGKIVPAPSGTRFRGYLTSHAAHAEELLLNVRRLEREVSDGVITYEQYEAVFERAVEYCKDLAPNIRYIECCNEIDIRSFGNLTADEYVKIYACACRAVASLNRKHQYPVPLQIGGYAAAEPLVKWDLVKEILRGIKEEGLPIDFYSYHTYDAPTSAALIRHGRADLAALGLVEKLRTVIRLHRETIAGLGLPERPIFFNELGRARATGVDGDSLSNAAGMLVCLNALDEEEFRGVYPFPWCTFHNPNLQISYTQYLLGEDGSYRATPNGIALRILHEMKGDRLHCDVSDTEGRDGKYRALAVKDGDGISLLCVNPIGDVTACACELSGLKNGSYRIDAYYCTEKINNCVTGTGDGTLSLTKSIVRTVQNGTLSLCTALEHDHFVLYRICKINE